MEEAVRELSAKYPVASDALRKWEEALRSLKRDVDMCDIGSLLRKLSRASASGGFLSCKAGMSEEDILRLRREEEKFLASLAEEWERSCQP